MSIKNTRKLPWWIWPAGLILHQLASRISIFYLYTPDISDVYLPFAISVIMIYWLGPASLLVIYLSTILNEPLWGHELYTWPFFGIPEVIFTYLSWLFYIKLLKGSIYFRQLKQVILFLIFGITIPLLIQTWLLKEILVFFGETDRTLFWQRWLTAVLGDFMPVIVIALPIMYFFSGYLEKRGLIARSGEMFKPIRRQNAAFYYEIIFPTASVIFLSLILDFGKFWYVFGIIALFVSLRQGFPGVLIVVFITVAVTYILPAAIFQQTQTNYFSENELIYIYLGNNLLSVFSIITGRLVSDLKYANRQVQDNLERIRKLDQEKIDSQMQLITLREQQNSLLEKQVHERTMELKELNDELLTQTEELATMSEELALQRDSLEEQNKIIEQKNVELQKAGEVLQKRIEESTHALKYSNKELVSQNVQLEQFAFMIAHNIRSPIARLLGLANIFNVQNPEDLHNIEVLTKLQQSAKDLDEIVREISGILRIKQGLQGTFVKLNTRVIMEKVLRALHNEIQENEVIFKADLDNFPVVKGIEAYIYSIFYNLLSNSIKYGADTRKIEISVETSQNDEFILLHFQDNGMGFDYATVKDKVFKPFTRFHTHKEGKGLGLFLIKIQMESMGGQLEIFSEPDKGFEAKLFFIK
ncbi:MAG: MASE1 domain-containing protein [Cyclobacteriaceae bacterium]|nr:MASE1 domain-containing protein [Cyclobacteriaceae bacterium]